MTTIAASSFLSASCNGTYFESSIPTPTLPCFAKGCQNSLTAQPNRILSWQIVFNSFVSENGISIELTPEEKQQHLQCLTDEVTRLGATNIGLAGYLGQDVTCEASYNQLQPIVQTSFISGVEVTCTPQDCNSCFQYTSEQACLADGFCQARYAQRYARSTDDDNCVEFGVYAGCGYWPGFCLQVLTPATSSALPDGECWLFSDSCLPDGFTPNRTACDENSFDTLPKCLSVTQAPTSSSSVTLDNSVSDSPTGSPEDASNSGTTVVTDSRSKTACEDGDTCETTTTENNANDIPSKASKANFWGLF
jgi:hypothetical protein